MKQTILSAKQGELLERLIVKYGQIVTSDQIFAETDYLSIKKDYLSESGNRFFTECAFPYPLISYLYLISLPNPVASSAGSS